MIGLGGLGCPAALELTRLGARNFSLLDPDKVAEENLHRQILYGPSDIDRPKVLAAKTRLQKDFPGIQVETIEKRSSELGPDLLKTFDLVLDGTDDPVSKFETNRRCVGLKIPCVIGGAIAYGGQSFAVGAGGKPCLACLFGDGLDADFATCETAGILGPVAGVVGALMAQMGAGLLAGTEPGGLVSFEGRRPRLRRVVVPPDPACPVCG